MEPAFHDVYAIELLLFYLLALGALFLPLRWGVFCMLVAGSVEVVRSGFIPTASVGWRNGVETLVIPAVLLLRMTNFRIPRIRWGFSAKVWTALVLYATVSILWSPFKLSGVKMVGFLLAWPLLYILFHLAWKRGFIDQNLIIAALWATLVLACVQTYFLGNPLAGTSNQFVPFTSPNSFGPFLVCILALLLFSRKRNRFWLLSVGVCLPALVLVGSRYSLIAAAVLLFIWWLLSRGAVQKTGGIRLAPVLLALALAVLVFSGFRDLMARAMPQSRINQLLDLTSKPQLADTGTFAFRLLMYQRVLSKLSQRSLLALTFGSGTSSGAEVAFAWQREYVGYTQGVDPNRTIHDEFLRATYEWGLIGLALGLALTVHVLKALWDRAIRWKSLAGFAALAILPGVFLALLVGNPLAGPGYAQGIGYLLVLSYGFSAVPPLRAAGAALSRGAKAQTNSSLSYKKQELRAR